MMIVLDVLGSFYGTLSGKLIVSELENGSVEIVDLSIETGDFRSYVSLPDGMKSHKIISQTSHDDLNKSRN